MSLTFTTLNNVKVLYVFATGQINCMQDKFLFASVPLLKLKVIRVGTFAVVMVSLID